MGMRTDRAVWWSTQTLIIVLVVLVSNLFFIILTPGLCYQDAVHITAILGESVVFNCHVEFPGDHPVPYVLQWEKKGTGIPIYIWYDSYPTHSGEGYEGRVSRVSPDSPYGLASLNLTDIRETDQGWYECKVVFLNRSPNQHKNGTWFHLDVHAPPRFSVTPEEIIYVNLGDAIILNCQAEGTPSPEILWYKEDNPVEPSATVGIFNDGTELRISNIRHEDIGDYICIARNGEGQISHTARVIIAGGAVIMVPPTNQTKLEGEKVQFACEAKAQPGNVTVKWLRESVPVKEVPALETRVTTRRDGSLVINPVNADDSGLYTCEVTNGIGEPQLASAYLNVEYPAKVTFTPTVQYLPFRLAGVVECYIKANPPLQYVTWTKDKRLLEPYQTKDIVIMNNGSLLFTRVNQNHQGRYMCTPYNAQGTQGSSGAMEVLVRKPPIFTVEPEAMYQRKVGETLEMHCEAQEAEGTQKPTIQWQTRNGAPLPKGRFRITGGNITIESLRSTDFGFYQCVASNEVATIVTTTQLIVEGTQPHAPYNVSGIASEFAVTLSWLPGYSGGPDYKQDYTIWYREAGTPDWQTIPVTPSGSTQVTINRLTPSTTYEFQVIGKNSLGDGMLSKVITVRTLDVPRSGSVTNPGYSEGQQPQPADNSDVFDHMFTFPTDSSGATLIPPIFKRKGPRPGPPRNLTVQEVSNGFLISWEPPSERAHLISHYTIKYRTDTQWKTLNKGTIRPEETQYLVKNLVGGRTYYFRVLANSLTSFEGSDEVKFPVPARVKHKAVTAGIVGGILFFIVAIILSVCAVKICNKRKRRRQEKAYNMVACRITDARNGGQMPGSMHVPLKNRVSGMRSPMRLLREALLAGVPRVNGDGEDSPDGLYRESPPIPPISRTPDGKFVLDPKSPRDSTASSNDSGGFLTWRAGRVAALRKPSWRRPLIGVPSELSLRSDGTGQSNLAVLYTPRIFASSPSHSHTPVYNFSDMSSVPHPSSAERSSYLQLKSMHEMYSQELPSLRALQTGQYFVPVQPSPRIRRQRYTRSAPDLSTGLLMETSPESRSSSSGFGSKNTSSQQNQSSQSDSTQHQQPRIYIPHITPPPDVGDWMDLTPVSPNSVDIHYEFDPVLPATPTPPNVYYPNWTAYPRMRKSRYDNVEARLQAMKEEFHQFRMRQQKRRKSEGDELESAC